MRPKPSEDGNKNNLPRSLYTRQRDPRAALRESVNSVFSDKFMILLSLILIPIIIVPFLVELPNDALNFLEMCDLIILILFITEYALKLYVAQDRWRHFKSPWHIVDLVIIVLPFMQYLPLIDIGITGSPSLLLRLLRIPRALAVSGRVIAGRRNTEIAYRDEQAEHPTLIRQVDSNLNVTPHLSWDDFKAHMADAKSSEWLDIQYISNEGFNKLSNILGIPEPHFKSSMVDEIYPHIDYVQKVSFIFLQSGKVSYPADNATKFLTISRSGIIVICAGKKIITVSQHSTGIMGNILEKIKQKNHDDGFVIHALYNILDHMLNEYRSLLSEIELEVIEIGNTERSKLPKDFLERIYQMDKEVSRLVSNLLHFKDMLSIITSRRVTLEGFDESTEEEFRLLEETSGYLNEIAHDTIENLRSIIDLYINQTSFEANRILKILAVITAISVIPSAVSGILGTNLLDVPYGATLWQLTFLITISMSFVAYTFVKLGWLKS
jgi:Mg2+ and Co2+ transporter CorA